MGSLPILEVHQNTPPLMGYKGGLGIWGVYNFIFLLTILYSMVRGFVYVNHIVYLCIVGNRVEDYGRGIHYLKESEVARPHHSKGLYNI